MFYVHMYYDLEYWWSLASSWPDDFRESLGQSRWFYKERVNVHRLNQFYETNYLQMLICFMYIYIYIVLLLDFRFSSSFQFGKFSIYSFFHWAHDFAHTLFFPPFKWSAIPPSRTVVVSPLATYSMWGCHRIH